MAEHRQGFVPGRHKIDAYGDGGFRFADMSHRGSLLVLPSGIHAIAAREPAGVDAAMLAPLFDEPAGAVELLIFGAGANLRPLAAAPRERLRAMGVMVEPMATGPAVRTYNMLMEEDRRVAAVLIVV
jgi:uncharacterized protein